MTDLDELDRALQDVPTAPPSFAGAAGKPAKCRRHEWETVVHEDYTTTTICRRLGCGTVRDEQRSRRGRQSRNYGNRAELTLARKYGGVKVGHAGGPVDIRGRDFNTQVKTHRRLPPAEWRKVFAALEASGERLPRLLLRFLPGPGLPPDDYFVIPAKAWLDWFGKDEDAA